LFFNILAYIPLSTLLALGRTDIFAKLYWIELAFYVVAAIILINYFGIAGAAAAWSLRVIIDAFAIMWISRRVGRVGFGFVRHAHGLLLASSTLIPVTVLALLYDNYSLWLLPAVVVSLAAYSVIVWNMFIGSDERLWIRDNARNFPGLR
jgi:O-antigen/teichoic acid export membrane protein